MMIRFSFFVFLFLILLYPKISMQFEIMYLLSEIQGPVEAGAVVVDQLGIGNFLADSVDQFCHFGDMWIWRFNPK